MAGAAGGGQDAKLQKLASKIESNEKLSGGHAVLVAVPAKRGGVLAAATGAVSGNVSNVVAARDRGRGGVDMASSAGKVLKMMGDGSDFVLCITDDALRIVRLIGFGILGGTPTIVPHADRSPNAPWTSTHTTTIADAHRPTGEAQTSRTRR